MNSGYKAEWRRGGMGTGGGDGSVVVKGSDAVGEVLRKRV